MMPRFYAALPLTIFITATLAFHSPAIAQDNGTYDATVTTSSGSYTVPVEVEDGEVTAIHWPNGGDMSVNGADLEGGSASGSNSRGDIVEIEIDNIEYFE